MPTIFPDFPAYSSVSPTPTRSTSLTTAKARVQSEIKQLELKIESSMKDDEISSFEEIKDKIDRTFLSEHTHDIYEGDIAIYFAISIHSVEEIWLGKVRYAVMINILLKLCFIRTCSIFFNLFAMNFVAECNNKID
ncbi:unnamed protein product [Lepeophtheirus salmonis]|uniref:(salmon louse) hypothetical protein n=1 Tax=Lepeophtheirus salmonis TaxID=72036 RepID=A0A7R8CHL9_LEPSM|nr:unnamed protein product [Lepeophtheirus salmonis]CAF2825171.1 unnamed protein product [Lepeophtheirus salmonis]